MTYRINWRHADFDPVKATLLLLMLMVLVAFSSVDLRSVAGTPTSNMLHIPYHSQDESLSTGDYTYCGVASDQMVLQYISGKIVPQPTLATELGTDYDSGTYLHKMLNPFINRGYIHVSIQHRDLDTLKQLNSEGYALIITIYYDTSHKSSHDVVMVGYNETGIMVNDPWPIRWNRSPDRQSGPNAFISNSLLEDLWRLQTQSVIIVTYQAYSSNS